MDQIAFSVTDFCKAVGISRSTIQKLWKQGEGPKRIWFGGKILIPADAAREWFKAYEEKQTGK